MYCSVLQCVAVSHELHDFIRRDVDGIIEGLVFIGQDITETLRAIKTAQQVCCSVLQSVAVCCSVLQDITETLCAIKTAQQVCCSVLQSVAVCCRMSLRRCALLRPRCSVLQCVAVQYCVMQCAAMFFSILQCLTVCCSVLQNITEVARKQDGAAVDKRLPVCCSVL